MNESDVNIIKASGDVVKFSESKLRISLEKSGASSELIEEIVSQIINELVEGMSTHQIYKRAFSLLRKRAIPVAAKYKLKEAIMELGPTGYPFEKFIGEILKFQGFDTEVGVMAQGKCVMHELDVVAKKGNKRFMIECKFHNRPGKKTDVKVPLYIQSRFLDVSKNWRKLPGGETQYHQGWVVTNTKFSVDAIDYGTCVGLHMMGWDYPKKGSLSDRIALSGLYPLTCLTTLTKTQKQQLIDANVVLRKDIYNKPEVLNLAFIQPKKTGKILKEVRAMSEIAPS